MKLLNAALDCFRNMETVSKRIILFGVISAAVTYVCGFCLLLLNERYLSDYTTGLYWFRELCMCSKEIVEATVVPVLIFEILYIVTGLKISNE